MKKLLFLLLMQLPIVVFAQEIWTEGTTWEVSEQGSVIRYELMAPMDVEGVSYMPLLSRTKMGCDTLAYIRSERGDTLVYARVFDGGLLQPECLLYDFSKSFCPGDVIRYGTCVAVQTMTIDTSIWPLEYVHDVLESGDKLPMWGGVIYKLGSVDGPLGLYHIPERDGKEPGTTYKPKPTNVSHLLFGTQKGGHKTIGISCNQPDNLVDAYRTFAFALFDQTDKGQAGNTVISPLSVQYALSMLQNGAVNNTRNEILTAMQVRASLGNELNTYNRDLCELLTERRENTSSNHTSNEEGVPVLEIANSIWSDTGCNFLESFYNTNRQYYSAETRSLDLSLQNSIDEVDAWLSLATHNTIRKSNIAPSDSLRMLLINTLYFKGGWGMPFSKTATSDGVFHNSDGSQPRVSMMQQQAHLGYFSATNFEAVRLLYGFDNRFQMVLFVPAKEYPSFRLTKPSWVLTQERLLTPVVDLRMPKFQVDGETLLRDALQSMGMRDAFSPTWANFSGIAENSLYVNEIKQLIHIEVDEDGTEASAATFEAMDTSVDPVRPIHFVIDRPFYFTIEEIATGIPLFIGHVRNLGQDATIIQVPLKSGDSGILYDLQGRRIQGPPRRGLYLRDGRKVMTMER